MILFERPWAAAFLFLPIAVHFLSAAYHTPRAALRVSVFKQLASLSAHQPGKGALILRRNYFQKLVLLFSWLCVIAALCQPVWLDEIQPINKPTRDLMMAVDLSASMAATDFSFKTKADIDRLTGVKQVMNEFVTHRNTDRLGLIVFGSRPYLQVPFTEDHALFTALLAQTRTRMAGPKTMLGDAVGLAVNHFSSSNSPSKVLIMLTDGNDSGSRIPPIDAAQVAADAGITIHMIAIGNPQASGEQAMDIATLKEMSAITGGVFFQASTADQLQQVYRSLDTLEPEQMSSEYYRPRQALFFWPLGLALAVQIAFQFTFVALRIRANHKFNGNHGVSHE